MSKVTMEGVKLTTELERPTGLIFKLSDRENAEIRIVSKRAAFKNKAAAVTTSLGITSIKALFENAAQDVREYHTDAASGDFCYDPEKVMYVTINGGEVKALTFAASSKAEEPKAEEPQKGRRKKA